MRLSKNTLDPKKVRYWWLEATYLYIFHVTMHLYIVLCSPKLNLIIYSPRRIRKENKLKLKFAESRVGLNWKVPFQLKVYCSPKSKLKVGLVIHTPFIKAFFPWCCWSKREVFEVESLRVHPNKVNSFQVLVGKMRIKL